MVVRAVPRAGTGAPVDRPLGLVAQGGPDEFVFRGRVGTKDTPYDLKAGGGPRFEFADGLVVLFELESLGFLAARARAIGIVVIVVGICAYIGIARTGTRAVAVGIAIGIAGTRAAATARAMARGTQDHLAEIDQIFFQCVQCTAQTIVQVDDLHQGAITNEIPAALVVVVVHRWYRRVAVFCCCSIVVIVVAIISNIIFHLHLHLRIRIHIRIHLRIHLRVRAAFGERRRGLGIDR